MSTYCTNREWSDRLIPQIKRIVGPFLLEPANFELDAKQATDLIVLNARDIRIAARVRRPGFATRFPYEFTIRSHVPSGYKTEITKVINGFGDWFFYGHADEETKISRWFLVDLSAFRAALIRGKVSLEKKEVENGDGTKFLAFDVRDFPDNPSILIGSSHKVEGAAA